MLQNVQYGSIHLLRGQTVALVGLAVAMAAAPWCAVRAQNTAGAKPSTVSGTIGSSTQGPSASKQDTGNMMSAGGAPLPGRSMSLGGARAPSKPEAKTG